MKVFIAYYSHGGNTAYVACKFMEALKKKADVDIFEISYSEGRKGFVWELLARIIPYLVVLKEIPMDLSKYDIIFIGTPVWGGRPAPPVLSYIKRVGNITNKRIVYFQVYGIEASAKKCLDYTLGVLNKKAPSAIVDLNIPWSKVHNEEYVDKLVNDILAKAIPQAANSTTTAQS
jgi:flavodoxin